MKPQSIPTVALNAVHKDLTSFEADLHLAETSGSLRATTATALHRIAERDGLSCFELSDSHQRYVRTLEVGLTPPGDRPWFQATGGLARWLRVNDELLISDRIDVWSYLAAGERDQLAALGADACLPLVVDGDLLAFVTFIRGGLSTDLLSRRPLLEACARHAARRWREVTSRERSQARTESLRRTQQLGLAGQVAASIAHEVRNPLAAVRSLVQFVRDVPLPDGERVAVLGDVLEEVDRIDHTLTGMLQLSQPASTVRQPIDIDAIVRSTTRFVRAYAGRRAVAIEVLPIVGRAEVLANEREVRQTITNLLLNACQACGQGGRVTTSVRLIDERSVGESWVELEVADSGDGVAPEHLPRLFEPFFTTKPQGTGLGLPFCRDVIERHGGTITIHSVVGVGTSVHVRLPLLEIDDFNSCR